MLSYKIKTLKRYDDITEVLVVVYRGEIIDVQSEDYTTGEIKESKKYQRTEKIGERWMKFRGNIAPTREQRDIYLERYLNKKLDGASRRLGIRVIPDQASLEPHLPIVELQENEL